MDTLKRKRSTIKSTLTRFETFLNTAETKNNDGSLTEADIIQVRRRLSNAELLLASFQDVQLEIDELQEDAHSKSNDDLDEFENKYYDIICAAEQLISNYTSATQQSKTSGSSVADNNSTNSFIKLPNINIPNFSGDHQGWLNFRDMFCSLIHDNKQLSNVNKLHYLKASLSGKAAETIKNLSLTSDNYQIAWNGLNERYNNSKVLIHHHIKGLFNLDSLQRESSSKLRILIDCFKRNLRSFESLVDPNMQRDALLMYLVHSKLDPITTREFENANKTDVVPQLSELISFIERKASLLETIEQRDAKPNVERSQSKSLIVKEQKCSFCNETHFIFHCENFKKLRIEDRIEKVKSLKLCLNCLSKGHSNNKCKSSYRCFTCKGRHNTLLHVKRDPCPSSQIDDQPAEITASKQQATTSLIAQHSNVLLSTAITDIFNYKGDKHSVRVLLDSGSQSNFITEQTCNILKLEKFPITINVTGLANCPSLVKAKCNVLLAAKHADYTLETSCLIIPEITGALPNQHIDISHLNIPENIKLADPGFNIPRGIDLLLGANVFYELMCIGQIALGPNQPRLQKTRFGWVFSGPISYIQTDVHLRCNLSTITVQEQLARFWELEELPSTQPLSPEEMDCESNFLETTKRNSDGRFVVKIPMKESANKLGDSYLHAKKCLYSLEKRLKANSQLREKYRQFLKEYIDLLHMSPSSNVSKHAYYLPHHGVIKEENISTKLRVVFNGSAKTTSGYSLNQIQEVGPVLQRDLFSIIMSFRMYQYAISADIEKMYRQVLVCPSQRHLQRIVWREDDTQEIQSFNLNTVTYGTAAASFLAIRCLHQLGVDCKETHPSISKIILNDFYVDDLLTGTNSLQEAIQICRDLPQILNEGCFPLRKWMSNDQRVLEDVNPKFIHPHLLTLGSHEHTKTLGLSWQFQSDSLIYAISDSNFTKVTKRTILSESAQIFDPLGLVGPCTVAAKLILQQLWLHKLDWDDVIPKNMYEKWCTLRSQLINLNSLKIPRHVSCANPKALEIHGFCDASTQAYGAVIYVRSVDVYGNIHCRILCSKTKVAPLKTITVPRLELCGAILLSRLADTTLKAMRAEVNDIYMWTDSTIVLGWLKTPPNQLKTFVSHRIAEIQNLSKNWLWLHVPTNENPADLLSRGCLPEKLINNPLWWTGPAFLKFEQNKWPAPTESQVILPEIKRNNTTVLVASKDQRVIQFNSYSNLTKLERIIAYCLRFKHNSLNIPLLRRTKNLTKAEIDNSLNCLIRIAQRECFPSELHCLQKERPTPLKSSILSLNPFLDKEGLIRVGGRIDHSTMSFSKKHPIILSGSHILTKMLFEREHIRLMHAGQQSLLYNVRERFWATSGRNLARHTVRKCYKCFRVTPRSIRQMMGSLPVDRVSQHFPFSVVGVDYAGPLLIKDKKGRGSKTSKCYICIFICFTVKAVHIELVSDLTTNSFIMALRRFAARRGKPSKIYSDNGSNFVGANNKLKEFISFIKANHKGISSSCVNENIEWHFIPPNSPHFGGLWEAGVKSVKNHLRRVAGDALLTFEELYTLLTQIESVLNSRPLSPLSCDPNDLSVLTPSHFLVGRPLAEIPDADVMTTPTNRLQRFEHIQKILQHFWRRWHREYLSELQERSKWKSSSSTQLKVDQLVLIKEDGLLPLRWKLGRVLKLHSGKDQVSRVATLKTTTGEVQRAVAKLCPLPNQ